MLIAEDRHCEICGTSRNLEVHHIEPRRMGGSSRPEIEAASNKAVLCRSCHTQVTEQRWRLERTKSQLAVTEPGTGKVVPRRLFNPDFRPSEYFHELNLLELRLDSLVRGIPYLSDEQLVHIFLYLRGFDQRAWKAQAAILWEAKQRSVYGDRAWEAMGSTFGIGWRQAYNLARVWDVFFLGGEGGVCNRMQNCSLQEVTWYIVATQTNDPHFWLGYAEDQKAQKPSYSIADFKAELAIAGGAVEDEVLAKPSPCSWLQMYCTERGEPVSPQICRACNRY